MTLPESRPPMRRRRRGARSLAVATTAAAAAVVCVLAGCSSSGSTAAGDTSAPVGAGTGTGGSGTSTGAGGSSCMSAAAAYLKRWDTLPTSLDSATYTPLAKPPKAGGKVVKIVGPVPSDQQAYESQAQAAKAIGWTASEVTDNGSVESVDNAFEQAISEKPTVITLSGTPVASIQKPLADAKAAGIVVSLSSITDAPTSYPGYAANSNGVETTALIGTIEAYEFMRASDCAGSVAIFSLPFPILDVGNQAFVKAVQQNCPKCTVSSNTIQTSDIGTPAATSAIVSKLQSSPGTRYVLAVIGNLADGLSTALAQANISGIQIFGGVPDNASIKALQDGTNAFWVNQSPITNGWTELDAALRAIQAGKPVTVNGTYPLAVLTPKNVPSGSALPVYPTDFRQEFTKLWTGK